MCQDASGRPLFTVIGPSSADSSSSVCVGESLHILPPSTRCSAARVSCRILSPRCTMLICLFNILHLAHAHCYLVHLIPPCPSNPQLVPDSTLDPRLLPAAHATAIIREIPLVPHYKCPILTFSPPCRLPITRPLHPTTNFPSWHNNSRNMVSPALDPIQWLKIDLQWRRIKCSSSSRSLAQLGLKE
jgi:hypothetical protein